MPHFEKMLYDNALLAPAYLHGWLVTGDERYREIVKETVEYMLRELWLAGGGLRVRAGRGHGRRRGPDLHVDAEDEGAPAELLEPFEHGRSILRGELEPELRAGSSSARAASEAAPRRQGDRVLERPRARGARRGGAEARAARTGSTRRRVLAEFLLGALSAREGGCFAASATAGRAAPGYLDDYANVAHGLLELHVATGELRWLEEASRLAHLAVELFGDDERGGFFLAGRRRQLVARTKALDDHPLPSGNSMLAHVLLRLARIYGDDELERRAVSVFRLVAPALERAPSAFGWALCALELWLEPAAGARDRRADVDAAWRARRWRRGSRTRSSPSGRPTACRCWPARASSTADRGLRLRALRLPGAGDRREFFTTPRPA